MAVKQADIRDVRQSLEAPLRDRVRTLVQNKHQGAVIPAAMDLAPASRAQRLTELFALLTAESDAARRRLIRGILARLRAELPRVLETLRWSPAHFGFRTVAEFMQFIGGELTQMRTGARSHKEFVAGLDGWRWNLTGRVLFERLVKHHPQLQEFFRAWADDWLTAVNAQPRQLVDLDGATVPDASPFGRLRRVESFVIEGADGVKRASVDFGFMATSGKRTALLPIEIKMPGALAGVAGQFAEFVSRLREARALYAIVDEGGPKRKEVKIETSSLVFLHDDRAQLAVAPLSKRRAAQILSGGRRVRSDDIASIADLDQGTSSRHALAYYRARVLVDREWLAAIVQAITDPP